MNIPEQLSSLSLEQANELNGQIDARISELIEVRKVTASMQEMIDAKAEIASLRATKADLTAIIAAASDEDGEEVVEEATEEEATEEEVVEEAAADEVVEEIAEEAPVAEETQEEVVASDESSTEQEDTVEAEVAETVEVTEDAPEVTSVEETHEAVAASKEIGEINVEINEPSESTATKGNITAAFRTVVDGAVDAVEAIEKVKKRENGGDAFKTIFEGDAVVNMENMTASRMTDYVMSLGTPGRESEASFAQKQYAKSKGTVAAAFCQPPQRIDADIQCGSYNRVIAGLFPSFVMDGLEVELFVPVDSSDADFVGEVALVDDSGDPLDSIEEKACYEAECLTRTTFTAREIKACLTANEQTAFTAPLAIQALLRDGEALLAALGDQLLLEQIIDQTYKMEYAAGTAGYGEVVVAMAIAIEGLARQSKITQVSDLVALVPASLLNYAVGDNAVRQFSAAQQAATDLFGGVGVRDVVVYDDALDATNLSPVPSLSKTVATTLTPRTDWSIHLINPADGFVGIRNENEYSLEPVAQSITEKRNNRLSWFARSYELFGRRGCEGWATVDISDLCLGGRVVAESSCLGSGS